MALFDALDALIEKDQDEARSLGLGEGDSDKEEDSEKEDDANADADSDAAGDAAEDIPDLPDEQREEYVQDLASSEAELLQQEQPHADVQEEEVDSEDEDLSGIEEPSGPRTSLKVNPSLEEALVGVPNIRTTNFNSKRQLTLD